MVSINTSMGMSSVGVPCGRRCAKECLVLKRRPMMTVPAHRGIAIARFIDSWVVGVNEWGKSPRRLVMVIKMIRDTSIRDQVCPLALWVIIICFRVGWIRLC